MPRPFTFRATLSLYTIKIHGCGMTKLDDDLQLLTKRPAAKSALFTDPSIP
jgi:hypothetical protein